ncbi:MAG: N-6 DNA methylase, partial [Desulfobacterales bacterium]|nr:N-6 DNA methylase [Desulfobacterales bacterium]
MQISQKDAFTTIRTEGAILPADLIQRISAGDKDIPGLTPKDYHLFGARINEAVNWSWSRLRGAWESFRKSAAIIPGTDPGARLTRERWLLPLFQELGYGRLLKEKAVELGGKSYPISHAWQYTPIHLVGCKTPLDRRTPGVAGAARMSPHAMVQEFLNRSDNHLWAFVSNGLGLRILRDDMSLIRQAFVEFDLEAMMDGEVYSDFIILWLLCHQSRVEAGRPEECPLEKWSRLAQARGTRALDQLRDGVEAAIRAIGSGFLSHPSNQALREDLKSGSLDKQEYYRQVLRLVYRLIFLFVAEDRGLLLSPDGDPEAMERYLQYYSMNRLRDLAARKPGSRHADIYYAVRLVMEKLGSDQGCPGLALPALGGGLFKGPNAGVLAGCDIANRDLLKAIRAITQITYENKRRLVDFKNLGSEELGSVYESLLELHPEINSDSGAFILKTAGGHERKTTGSYYTPSGLVQCLLESALDPLLDDALEQDDPEAALLNLKVCDPACGSGHFLVAAAHRIAKRLAAAQTGDDEPGPDAVNAALRQVIGRCVYGVDLNPMAVELCKVSLWLEAMEPGKPLSFLDHHIHHGNSLLGATPALLEKGIPDDAFKPIEGDDKKYCLAHKKMNKKERSGQMSLFDPGGKPWEKLGNLAAVFLDLDRIDDSSIEGVRGKQEAYEKIVQSGGYLFGRMWADAWCAAFVWKKRKSDKLPYPITEEVFRRIEKNPYSIGKAIRDEITRLAEQYRFFHWHLAFPDVFRLPKKGETPGNEEMGWSGGFDVVLGNPPWEKLQTEALQFFATRDPEIARLKGAKRKKAINDLKTTDAALAAEWDLQRRIDAARIAFIRNSGRYPLTGVGKFNAFALFAETKYKIIGNRGMAGCVVPTGIATDDTTKLFFKDAVRSNRLTSLYDFQNDKPIFHAVHRQYKFCLLTLGGNKKKSEEGSHYLFNGHDVGDLKKKEKVFTLSAKDISTINPNTLNCPIFSTRKDAEIAKRIYRDIPVFKNLAEGADNPYDPQVWRLLNTTDDSAHYIQPKDMNQASTLLPVIEAKMIHQFDHRFASYDPFNAKPEEVAELSLEQKRSTTR